MPELDQLIALRLHGNAVSLAEVLRELDQSDDEFRVAAASRLIIRRESQRRGVCVTDAELQQAADSFRDRRGLSLAETTRRWLAARHWSVSDFEAHLELPLLREKLAAVIAPRGEIERRFAERRRLFEQAEIAHLVVTERAVADELLAQLRDDDADFGDLARLHSIDPLTARLGGRIGVTDRAALSAEIEAAVFSARDGSVVGPLQTSMGWHLILVSRVIPGQLDDDVCDVLRAELFDDWLNVELRAVAFPTLNGASGTLA